ncbi:MAG: FG-GAP-like repeat-containing protein [Candidatus Eisenbacteria bacterium]
MMDRRARHALETSPGRGLLDRIARTQRLGSLVLVTLLLTPAVSQAHLALIRQGSECFGFAEPGDRHGSTLAAGDFNGDGYDDLAMGAPNEDHGSAVNAGTVYIDLGSSAGVTHVGSYAIDFATDFGYDTLANVLFGQKLLAVDLDNDNLDDLVVGATGFPEAGNQNAGRIFLYRGTPSGLVPWGTLSETDVGGFPQPQDRFGYSLAAGDFDADGDLELVVGSPGWDATEGAVFVIQGTPAGPWGPGQVLKPGLFGETDQVGDYFGGALATGNLVGDTRTDLIIAAPNRDVFGSNAGGICYVLRGATGSGLSTSDVTKFTAKIVDDVSALSYFGLSLAVGQFAPGTYDYVAVAEPGRTIGADSGAGRVVIAKGGPDGVEMDGAYILTSADVGNSVEENEFFGMFLGSGYYDGDTVAEDLLVGCPWEGFTGEYEGAGYVVFGGGNPLGQNGWIGGGTPWEGPATLDMFGFANVIGEFDGTNKGNWVASAPGKDDAQGTVYVIAPWRQPPTLGCKTAVATDCMGDLIFSLKPFDEVLIASTTKVMTVLLACERTQLPTTDPLYMSPHEQYWVPEWIPALIGGSLVPLAAGEWMTLEDLMTTCLYRSGNDAAHAIADLLHGANGPDVSIPAFVAEMNARALELGMLDTSFNNPNGFEQEAVGPDLGEHHSTAYDMALLTRAAMQNPRFVEIAGKKSEDLVRHFWWGDVGYQCDNFFGWMIDNGGSGVKGGWTPAAETTGCFSAPGTIGHAVATTFYTLDGDPAYGNDAMNLVNLAQAYCESWQYYYDEDPYLHPIRTRPDIHAVADTRLLFGAQTRSLPMDMQIDLFRAAWEGVDQTDAYFRIGRISTCELLSDDSPITFEIEGASESTSLVVRNLGQTNAQVAVRNSLGYHDSHTITPGHRIVVPGGAGTASGFWWTVQSLSGRLELSVEENYVQHVVVDDSPVSGPIYSAILHRESRTLNDSFQYEIEWVYGAGAEYILVEHEAGVVADVPPGAGELDGPRMPRVLASASPNPFAERAEIQLTLAEEAAASVVVYDVAGRVLRELGAARHPVGTSSVAWDGMDARGVATPPGVYFYQVLVDGLPGPTGKLTRVR